MESVELIAAGVGVVGAGLAGVGAVFATRAFRTARLILTTPATPVAQLDAGLHEVKGSLGADATLESPLSRRACGYWHLVVEQRVKNRWEALVDRRDSARLWLDDGSGRAALPLDGAQVVVSAPARVSSGIFGVPSAELDDLLQRLGMEAVTPQGPFLRYREETLVGGDRLYAVAGASRTADGWSLVAHEGVFVVSDRDEAEVVRHQNRSGQRWLAAAAAGVAALGAAAWIYLG